MTRASIALLLALSSGVAIAEGPGTRIRAGSQLPQPQSQPRGSEDPCAHLTNEARRRCLEKARQPAPTAAKRSGSSGASAPK